ncbi:hypothetical protein GCM10017653_18460 [Ancylobacter defluvii]|uniref:Uncharacterized protein n=1 Tax=Ancylobacter defluvii TaxID=1282440 RepID=A0A9W6JU39_9HYPH|nr:hypothetical protein GCM10017653_18460 [Ancylobacter defluvii]
MKVQLASVASGVSRKLFTDQKVMATRKPSGTTKNASCQTSGGRPQKAAKRSRVARADEVTGEADGKVWVDRASDIGRALVAGRGRKA